MTKPLLYYFLPQKVLHVKDALKKKRPKTAGAKIVTVKEDGWWGCADYHPELGWSSIHSSSLSPIPALEWMRERMDKWKHPFPACRFIFEITVPETPFTVLNGYLKRQKEQCPQAVLSIHDILIFGNEAPSVTGWLNGAATPAEKRWKYVTNPNLSLEDFMQRARVLGITDDLNLATQWFEDSVERGEEGIVLKDLQGTYEATARKESLMKMKQECEADLLCIGLEEGFGEKGNPSLTLLLKSANGLEHKVLVPKIKDRERFTADPSEVLNRVVKIRAMQKLETGAYRQPIFAYERVDKLPTDID